MDRYGFLKPRVLPFLVAALVVPTVIAAVFGGPGLGLLVAVITLGTVLFVLARRQRGEPIESASSGDPIHRVLLVLSEPVKDLDVADEVVAAATRGAGKRTVEILALAPTQPHFLDLWASDVRSANAEAQEKLDLTVATLKQEHVSAEKAIGDSDIVLAVEDALRSFAADEVILATGPEPDDPHGSEAADDLRDRLVVPFDHVITGG